MMTRAVAIVAFGLMTATCASTTHYPRSAEAERAVDMAVAALQPGMTLHDVVVVMLNMRRSNQYAALESARKCEDATTEVVVHAGELLGKVGRTRVHAAGFASLQTMRGTAQKSEGFERQGALLDAIRERQGDCRLMP